MIDWPGRVRELKRMADELDMWSRKTEGRGRLVLGRLSDELKQFADEIERALTDEQRADQPSDALPEWLAEPALDDELIFDDGDEAAWSPGES
jgi:hypothetical protein